MIQQEPILIIQNSQIKPASTNIFASNSKTTKTLLLLIIRTSVESAQTRNLSGHSLSSMGVCFKIKFRFQNSPILTRFRKYEKE
jgi:hypothetical protein